MQRFNLMFQSKDKSVKGVYQVEADSVVIAMRELRKFLTKEVRKYAHTQLGVSMLEGFAIRELTPEETARAQAKRHKTADSKPTANMAPVLRSVMKDLRGK